MSVPAVNLNELDGALGVLPSGTRPLAIVGNASSGPIGLPAAFARTKDVVTNFTSGPVVEAAARWIQVYNRPCIIVRTGASVAAAPGTIDTTGKLGTSAVTSGTSAPDDFYEPFIKVLNGGTIGVTGITYQWSLDNGRTMSAATALGTATAVTLSGYSGGTGTFLFGAGTLLAGDTVKRRDNPALWNSTELGTGLTALQQTAISWDLCEIVGPMDAAAFDVASTAFAAFPMSEKAWIGSARMPLVGESEAAYLSAINTIFSAKADPHGMLCAGAAKITSGITFRSYRRHAAVAIAALQAAVSEEIDIAAIDVGNLPGVDIRDINGNPDEHDEFINPGLDDARFAVLRTHGDIQGVYVNNPRIFSSLGSDFEFMQHRRVMNLAKTALRLYFQRRLSKPVLVNAATGFILEAEALEIEAGANAILRSVLMAKPKASGGGFSSGRDFVKLSRTDNLLSTKTLNVQAGIVPLAYFKAIFIDIGFRNPALQVVAA
jgi:hypothetical protein